MFQVKMNYRPTGSRICSYGNLNHKRSAFMCVCHIVYGVCTRVRHNKLTGLLAEYVEAEMD